MADIVLQVYNRIESKMEYFLLDESESINLASISLRVFMLHLHENKEKLEFMLKAILNKYYDSLLRGVICHMKEISLNKEEKHILDLYNQQTTI